MIFPAKNWFFPAILVVGILLWAGSRVSVRFADAEPVPVAALTTETVELGGRLSWEGVSYDLGAEGCFYSSFARTHARVPTKICPLSERTRQRFKLAGPSEDFLEVHVQGETQVYRRTPDGRFSGPRISGGKAWIYPAGVPFSTGD